MKILDCTLRDGGYYTNWDFDQELVATYLDAFNHLPVDYLEVGYRSMPLKYYFGEYFYCSDSTLQKLKTLSQKKLAIILNEKDVLTEHAETLLKPCQGIITLIRIAVDPKNFQRAIKLAEAIRAMGFEVAFNVMYMSNWKQQPEFLKSLSLVNGLADYFYLVDSFGGVYPEDVKELVGLAKDELTCQIGFHGHNNLELALINTLTAMQEGVDMVDATVTGMGRGAGNLKTELLLTSLNARDKLEVDFNKMSAVVAGFEDLREQHRWGTNLPYMVSGANSIPQKEVMEWVSKRFYSINSIIRALSNRSRGIKDNESVEALSQQPTSGAFTKALVVGGGPSVIAHATALKDFVSKNPDMVVVHASSKNAYIFGELTNEQFFCLVGNEGHRMEQVFGNDKKIKGKCVLPPYPRKMGTYIPSGMIGKAFELDHIEFANRYEDSHTALALQTCLQLGVQDIYFAGYDGYANEQIGEKEQGLFLENEYLFRKMPADVSALKSVTPTQYEELIQESVYQHLI